MESFDGHGASIDNPESPCSTEMISLSESDDVSRTQNGSEPGLTMIPE